MPKKNIDDIVKILKADEKQQPAGIYREKRKEQEKEKRRYPIFPFLIGCLPALVLLVGVGLLFAPRMFESRAAVSMVTRERTVHTSPVMIQGSGAQGNARLSVLNNGDQIAEITADGNGNFMFPVVLSPGINTVTVVGPASGDGINPDGNSDGDTDSGDSSGPGGSGDDVILTEIINFDPSGPFLQITNPPDGAEFTAPHILVTGITDPGATVTVEGENAPVAPDGSFILPITLEEGSNTIDATATNPNGTAEDSVTVTYDDTPTPPGGGGGSTPPGGSGSTPPGGGGSTPPGGGGVTPPGGGSGSTPPGGSGSTPPGGGGSTPPGGSGSTPPGGGGSTPPGGGSTPPPIVIFPSKVIISKVLYTGDSPDGSLTEYIEIRNTGAGDEDISGWQVYDTNGHIFTFPSYTMAPGQVIRVTTNQAIGFSFASSDPVWDRLGEPAYMKNSAGDLVDVYSYN